MKTFSSVKSHFCKILFWRFFCLKSQFSRLGCFPPLHSKFLSDEVESMDFSWNFENWKIFILSFLMHVLSFLLDYNSQRTNNLNFRWKIFFLQKNSEKSWKIAVFSIFWENCVILSIFVGFFWTAMKIQVIVSEWLSVQKKRLKVH